MTKQYSDADKAFWKYKPYIIECILEKSKTSYANLETVRDRWIRMYEYSPALEQYLITKSQDFLYIVLKSREYKFLGAVTKQIADYLSEYTVRKYNLTDREEIRQARKQEKQRLFDAIYTESTYIKKLKYKNRKNNVFYGTSDECHSSTIARSRARHDALESARRTRELRRQIKDEFATVSTYKKR